MFARAAVIPKGAEVRDYRPGRGPANVCIIIPARDEVTTLPRCLQSLLDQNYDGVMRLVVSDNGSTDGTVALARTWAGRFEAAGHEVIVLHLPEGNKCAALNAADAAARDLPRIYLDADVELSPTCVAEVVAALAGHSGVAMCSPQMRIARSPAWVTRRYARVWGRLPWVRDDAIGGGFYAVSASGRRRWGPFPDLLSEDSFVQAQFRRCERRVLNDCYFQIHLPDGFRDLLKVRTRQFSGNRQLARQCGGEWGRAAFPLGDRIRFLLTTPALWPDLPLYFFINALARRRARRREAIGTRVWERARPAAAEHHDADEAELASMH
ncbi:MAG TPA: glycosyltransferase family 2 protein [Tepidisphaeraceae bacterium]